MKCSYFLQSQCKSCNLLDKSYQETLLKKEDDLKKLFPHSSSILKPSIGIENDASGSRTKAKFAVFMKNDELTFGFTNSDGSATELENCPLHANGINELLPSLKLILKKYNIIPYDLKTKKGELKYLLVSKSGDKTGDKTGNSEDESLLLRFVLRSKECLDRLRIATQEILELNLFVSVITANIQPEHKAILEGDEEILLTSNHSIIHQFDEFQLALGARSFFQVTPEIAKKLYGAVAECITKDSPKSLIDLYCGVGAFSFYASRWCEDVFGVEISKEAIDCAKLSVKLNKSKIQFFAMDVEDYLFSNPKQFEAVIVNPPRRGLNSKIIEKIKEINPQFIYYSSCNAQSLHRDFLELEAHYNLVSLQIFDMFPYTDHYETLMCLKIKNKA